MRSLYPGTMGALPPSMGAKTSPRRLALPCTNARTRPGEVPLTLSYSACRETGRSLQALAAACKEGRKPTATTDMSSTVVENSSWRVYCKPRSCSKSSSIQPGSSALCMASLAMTVTGLCSTQRCTTASITIARTSVPLGCLLCYPVPQSSYKDHLERSDTNCLFR
jgi:hypothetical protein